MIDKEMLKKLLIEMIKNEEIFISLDYTFDENCSSTRTKVYPVIQVGDSYVKEFDESGFIAIDSSVFYS